jgi:hypothetical protein
MSEQNQVQTCGGNTHHKVGIADVVLDNTASKNDNSGLLGKDCLVVHIPNIRHNINDQTWALVRVKVDHITQRAVRQCRTEHWDVVLQSGKEHREPC